MIEKKKLSVLLDNCLFGNRMICREVTDSTNLEICCARKEGAKEGCLAIAEQQTAGKGRRGRNWSSPPGENLYFSLLLCPQTEPSKASMVTLLMAMAVVRAVRGLGLDGKIKWPNDVVLSGKKVCGILTELFFESDGGYYVVIGTGINVNQTVFAQEIQATAASLKTELDFADVQSTIDRENLLCAVLKSFEQYYGKFQADGDLSGLRMEYEEMLANRNMAVKVLDPKGAWEGVALGINDTGELLVRRPDGGVEAVYAGEVSVRGIYGYV
ncbi:MAG: biotin--[Lachnospiraceae bacterium]|nr:biotin--[acetyl-CoA-carboxylase] ligase [Lachnospiraceae bacterium]